MSWQTKKKENHSAVDRSGVRALMQSADKSTLNMADFPINECMGVKFLWEI